MNRLLSFAVVFLFLSASGHAQPAGDALKIMQPEGPKPWTSLELNNDPGNFQFAIVTDRTGGHRPGVFLDGVRKINLLQPEFVMSVGDLIEGYTEDTVELHRQWEEFDGFIDELEMPFFYVPGNHDITNAVMDSVYRARYGQTSYYFIYHDVLFLCLNSEDQYRGASRGSISDEQYEWIQDVLEKEQDVRWTLLFMHQPLWLQDEDPVRWNDVEALLRDRQHTVFVGHRHHYVKYDRNNGKYFMLATTGGASSLRGPELGEFDHVVWVTMTDEGPVVANLHLDGILSENLVTEQTQAFIDTLQAMRPLRIEPLYVESAGAFEGGNVRIRMTNDFDIPMVVRLNNKFSFDFKSSLDQQEVTVPPNSVAFAELEVEPRRPGKIENTEAVPLNASISYDASAVPDVEYPLSYLVRPELRYNLEKINASVAVDGDLAEWKNFPYHFGTDNPADCSVDFQVAYDEEFLYLSARVTDDDVRVDPKLVAWNQDFIGIVINGDPLPQSAMRKGAGWYRESVLLTMTPEMKNTPTQTFYEDRLEGTDYKYACKAVEGGYTMEFALPLSYLRERQGDDWRTARINLMVQDWDAGEEEKPRFSWQPDWRGADNRVGSGMFFNTPAEENK